MGPLPNCARQVHLYRHYLLAFHDETFECIARSHSLKHTMSSFPEALELCTKSILA